MNKLIQAIGRCCSQHLLSEKYLVCPSLRTGQIWLDRTAMSGIPPLNVRTTTIKGFAFRVADRYLRTKGLKTVKRSQSLVIIHGIISRLEAEGGSYFSGTRTSVSLLSGIADSINTLRLAGLTSDEILPERFEAQQKGFTIQRIFAEYTHYLDVHGMVDYPDVLNLAKGIILETFSEGSNRFILVPDDMDFSKLENDLLAAIPSDHTLTLETEDPTQRMSDPVGSDCDLLIHFSDPHEAPMAQADGTARMFHARGISSEIREVFRRILTPCNADESKQSIAFDEVEILHTDYETYVPTIFEIAQSLMMSFENDLDSIPMTFAEGIPVKFSRPARALNSWLKWMNEGYPQTILVDMISDGLISREQDDDSPSDTELTQALREKKIISGLDRSLQILQDHIFSLIGRAGSAGGTGSIGDSSKRFWDGDSARQILCYTTIMSMVERLAFCSPDSMRDSKALLSNTVKFLNTCARSSSELDNYSLKSILENLQQMIEALGEDDTIPWIDMLRWIRGLTQNVRVMASGPRPGMIHLDNIYSGGHTGRLNTFIIGMDDERFPGSGGHDPLLMDIERTSISPDLPQVRHETGKRLKKFGRLLSRLHGNVTLSYSSIDMRSDRSAFPSGAFFSLFRVLSNRRESDPSGMQEWLGLPASFAPVDKKMALTLNEWLLTTICSENPLNSRELVASLNPDITHGLKATESRLTDDFTVYDGNIGPVEPRHDPTHPDGPVMSSASLETIGYCPLKYFFKYILRIQPVDNIESDPSRWMDNMQLGSLLHETFYYFMTGLVSERRHPNVNRDKPKLQRILADGLATYSRTVPPPNESAKRRQSIWLEKSMLVFLVEEEIASRQWAPLLLEATIGMKNRTEVGSFENPEPVKLHLTSETSVRVSGKLDRVDEKIDHSPGHFRIIDYKTGSPSSYQDSKNYRRGKIIQHAIYVKLAQNLMTRGLTGRDGTYDFVYFFPTVRAHGVRIIKYPKDAILGTAVTQALCDIVSSGAFLATQDGQTCSYCDYSLVCGSGESTAGRSKDKLDNVSNTSLDNIRKILVNV